jgi:hypothetical protein
MGMLTKQWLSLIPVLLWCRFVLQTKPGPPIPKSLLGNISVAPIRRHHSPPKQAPIEDMLDDFILDDELPTHSNPTNYFPQTSTITSNSPDLVYSEMQLTAGGKDSALLSLFPPSLLVLVWILFFSVF